MATFAKVLLLTLWVLSLPIFLLGLGFGGWAVLDPLSPLFRGDLELSIHSLAVWFYLAFGPAIFFWLCKGLAENTPDA